MNYELIIKNGTVVDPAQGIHARKDVAFANGRVSAISDDIPTSGAREILDAEGCFVTPGLIDLHVHVFYGVSHFGIEPDPTCLHAAQRQSSMRVQREQTRFRVSVNMLLT